MIEGKKVRITNPKTFVDGLTGKIMGKVRPGLYRISLETPMYDERILAGNEFVVIED